MSDPKKMIKEKKPKPTTLFAEGTSHLVYLNTQNEFDCYSLRFKGKNCISGEELEVWMNKWNRPIALYEKRGKDIVPILNTDEYEGAIVRGTVAYTTAVSKKGKLCYNAKAVLVESVIDQPEKNPFLGIYESIDEHYCSDSDEPAEFDDSIEPDDFDEPDELLESNDEIDEEEDS